MADVNPAFLVLKAAALAPENQVERDRLLADLAERLNVVGEVDLVTITNTASEGTNMAARFPVSQSALKDVADDAELDALFITPDPS
ncbi:MAG TPA: hypothetical protein VN756_06815 [Solirubrobacterales bacterium]|nr:hypothetical protein [Solirubrobacterales bacterium]